MPKDWDQHKHEIERLYIVERRPLKEVRNILEAEHGFIASIRAYRMKLDEWQLRKNNSKHDRRIQKEASRREAVPTEVAGPTALPLPATPSKDTHLEIYGVSIPTGPIDISDLLPILSTLPDENCERGVEIMLLKWVSNGTFLEAAVKYLHDNECTLDWYFNIGEGKNIFHLIQDKVDIEEQLPLVKACLEVDLKYHQPAHPPFGLQAWYAARLSNNWQYARAALGRGGGSQSRFFSDCCFVVMAEKYLKEYMAKLESQRGDLDDEDDDDTAFYRREYMNILDHFSDRFTFDVDPSFYKYTLQLSKWNDRINAKTRERQRKQIEELEQYRENWVRLERVYGVGVAVDGMINTLLSTADFLRESQKILQPLRPGFAEAAQDPINLSDRATNPTTRTHLPGVGQYVVPNSHDTDDHYTHRQPESSSESLSLTPDHTPLATASSTPRLRPHGSGYELPGVRNLDLQHAPDLSLMEPQQQSQQFIGF